MVDIRHKPRCETRLVESLRKGIHLVRNGIPALFIGLQSFVRGLESPEKGPFAGEYTSGNRNGRQILRKAPIEDDAFDVSLTRCGVCTSLSFMPSHTMSARNVSTQITSTFIWIAPPVEICKHDTKVSSVPKCVNGICNRSDLFCKTIHCLKRSGKLPFS